jgi:hypothetical protein
MTGDRVAEAFAGPKRSAKPWGAACGEAGAAAGAWGWAAVVAAPAGGAASRAAALAALAGDLAEGLLTGFSLP